MTRLIYLLISFAVAQGQTCSSRDCPPIVKTTYESFDCSVDFAEVLGSDGSALTSVTAAISTTGADVTSTLIAASPVPAIIAAVTGTVNVSGTSVTWVSGTQFLTTWPQGFLIQIGNAYYQIASLNSATSLTLATSAGVQTGVAYTVANKVSWRVQNGQNNVLYRISVKISDTTNGAKWEGVMMLQIKN